MKNVNSLKIILSFILFTFFVNNNSICFAQTKMQQEVRVVKPYEPVILDAVKISELPKIVDTAKVSPEFIYNINPVKYQTTFIPQNIKPAKLISEPLPKLYLGYFKGGFGTYISPLAELYIGTKRSTQWNFSSTIVHNSTYGKIKNSTGKNVFAGNSYNKIGLNGSYFLKNNLVINVNSHFINTKNYFYGYNPLLLHTDSVAPLDKKQIENRVINNIYASAGLKTNHTDSTHVNYNLLASFNNTTAKDNTAENILKINTDFNYFLNNQFFGIDLALDYIKNQNIDDTVNGALVKFNPWVGAFGKKWRVVAGVSTYYDQPLSKYHFYPRLSMHYNIIDYFLIPYFELQGNYYQNTYSSIVFENPYITPGLGVKPTDNLIKLTFGFRGNISSAIAFNIKIDYDKVNNQYFYVNDTNEYLQNKFTVTYDNMLLTRFLGEISYKSSHKLYLSVKANYYHYSLSNQLKAWHLPNYDISFYAQYKMQDKIIISTNIFAKGNRYAQSFDVNNNIIAKELQGVIDANIGVEYRLSKKLSAYIQLNNIAAAKYYQWNNYPTQRFNAMAGFTFAF